MFISESDNYICKMISLTIPNIFKTIKSPVQIISSVSDNFQNVNYTRLRIAQGFDIEENP